MTISSLQGRVILITGAAGSLGRIAAKACAAQGASLILLDKAVERLEFLHDEILAQGHTQPALYPLDLAGAVESDYLQLAATLNQEFGALHGLLHSAAELGSLGPMADVDGQNWQKLIHVNLTAAHLLTRAVIPLLLNSAHAAVIFTTDSAARKNPAYWGAYGVAKAGLEHLAAALAAEYQSRASIRFNLFEPGPVQSAIRNRSHPGELPESLRPAETLGAEYVRLMAAPMNDLLNGEVITASHVLNGASFSSTFQKS